MSKGWITVLGGFLIHLVLGSLYVWANITSAVTSYLRQYQPELTYDDTIKVYAGALAAQGCTMLLGGIITQRIGPKLCCFFGASILISGTLLASFSQTFVEIFLCQGIMLGLGIGLCYTAPISASVKWMPKRKGLVTGIIVGGFGCGAFVFGFIATSVVNPNHVNVESSGTNKGYFPPNSEVVERVPLMFLVLTFAYIVCMGAGCCLLSEPTHEEIPSVADESKILNPLRIKSGGYHAAASDEREDEESASKSFELTPVDSRKDIIIPSELTKEKIEPIAVVEMSPMQVVKTSLAWHVATCLITTAVGGMYLAGTFKTYGQQSIENEAFLASICSTASLFNTGGRFFWGWLADQIGPVRTVQIMSLLFALTIITYANSVTLGEFGFGLWTYLIFFFEGANFVLYVPITVLLFGAKYSASNYGMIFSSYSFFVVLNICVMSGAKVGFQEASLYMGLLTFIGFINVLLLELHIKYGRPPADETPGKYR